MVLKCLLVLPLVVVVVKASVPQQFLLDIEEQGWEFTQTLQLDEEANTERIQVPHHNQVQATTFIHDFNKNLTLRIIQETGACYLTDLAEMIDHGYLVPPRQMKKDLRAAQQSGKKRSSGESESSEVVVVLQEWTFGSVVSEADLQRLSQEMRDACENTHIRWLHRLRDHASVRSTDRPKPEKALPSRHRRQVDDDIFEPECSPVNLKFRCKKELISCQYIYYETCDAEMHRRGRRRYAKCIDNTTLHIIDEVKCCRECCTNQVQADDYFPYCETFGDFSCTDI